MARRATVDEFGRLDQTAWSSVDGRKAIRVYRRLAYVAVVVAFAMLMALGTIAGRLDDRAETWMATADEVPGIVVSSREIQSIDWITIDYTYQGESYTGRVWPVSSTPGEYFIEGRTVPVLVDPDDPERMSLVGETSNPPWIIIPWIVGFLGFVVMTLTGVQILYRAVRMSMAARGREWESRRAQATEYGTRRLMSRRPHVVQLTVEGFDQPIMIKGSKLRLRGNGFTGAGRVDIVGKPGGNVVVRAPGSRRVFLGSQR